MQWDDWRVWWRRRRRRRRLTRLYGQDAKTFRHGVLGFGLALLGILVPLALEKHLSAIMLMGMVAVVMMGRVKEGRRREKEEEMKVLQKQVMLLQKQVDALKGVGVKQSVAKESPTLTKNSPTLTKKESKKKKV